MNGSEGCRCDLCGRRYRVDLMIPDGLWAAIGMRPDGGGLLCGLCIMRRIEELGKFGVLHAEEDPCPAGSDYPTATYAVIHVVDGPSHAWPVVERVAGGWQSGAHHYPDHTVASVRKLPILTSCAHQCARDWAEALVFALLSGDRTSELVLADRIAQALAEAHWRGYNRARAKQ